MLNIFLVLQSSWMSLLNPRLNQQHVVQITTGEGTCRFCSWHFLLLTYAGSCFTPTALSKRIRDWQNNRSEKTDANSDCNVYSFLKKRKKETLKHHTVPFVIAGISGEQYLNPHDKYNRALMCLSQSSAYCNHHSSNFPVDKLFSLPCCALLNPLCPIFKNFREIGN